MTDRQQAKIGTSWATISTIVVSAVQIFRIAILTRFLDKADFGIVAIVSFVLGMTYVFSDLGFSVAIVHKKKISNNEFSCVFWMQMLLYVLIFIILSISSPFIASFYNQPDLIKLIPIALLDLIFQGIGKSYDAVLLKSMKFKIIAIRNIVASLLSILVAIWMAYAGCGIYSMIVSTLFFSAFNNIWNYIAGQKEYKIKLHFSFSETKPFFAIGIYKTGTQIFDYFSSKLDVLIIGKLLGIEELGVYNLAKELVFKMISIVQSIVSKVALPIYAKNQDDLNTLRRYYCKLLSLVSYINLPICCATCVFSSVVVTILYGKNFIDCAIYVSLFSYVAMINSVGGQEGSLVSALGRTKLDFQWTVIRIVLSIVLISVASFLSLQMVIFAQIIISIIGFFYVWRYILYDLIKLKFIDYLYSFWRIGLISLFCSLMYFVVKNNKFNLDSILIQTIVYFCCLILLYTALVLVFDRSKFIENKQFIISK